MTRSSATKASAEAIFGSAARGDTDRMSDRDILIVDSDTAILRRRTSELESDGWSVASYTFAKLEALAERGALFVQHLKLESRILVDLDDRLAELLRSFQPLGDYGRELIENGRLARLASAVPEGARGTLLAADILYVTVRNFGVLRLAERDKHVYSFEVILKELENEGLLDANAASALKSLRFLKCLYRAGEQDGGGHALELLNRALRFLPAAFFPASVEVQSPFEILKTVPPETPAPPYLMLRDLERRLVALVAIDATAELDRKLSLLTRWIANPRAYAALSGRFAPRMRAAIDLRLDLSLNRILAA